MIDLLTILKSRNEALFYFGLVCLVSAVFLFLASKFSLTQVNAVNAWYKPLKFALSIGIFAWTMGWYTGYLQPNNQIICYSWAMIILLGFELFYIALQAARGQFSHYNVSSPIYTALTIAMAVAAIAATLYTGYIGILFCTGSIPEIPAPYLWAIRMGIFLFVIFAFEGAIIGANGSHTVGGTGDNTGIPLLNWSRKYGDLRIAHFVGMHALQLLPLMAYYIFKDTRLIFISGLAYAALAVFVLLQALNGRSFLSK